MPRAVLRRLWTDSAASAVEVGAKEQFSGSFIVLIGLHCCLLMRKAAEAI